MSKDKTQLSLSLLEELNKLGKQSDQEVKDWKFPYNIDSSLYHTLRDYQIEALFNFHLVLTHENFQYRKINHVLFHMATGSGKTDLMAALILYLYQEHGYQRYVFTVNSNSVLQKTKENLFKKESEKHLYQDPIIVGGKRIIIKEVKRFSKSMHPNEIHIKAVSVQGLSSELQTRHENVMGIHDYQKNKVVILGDEAHHYSANTKKEKDEEGSWEYAINSILNAHKKSILLEFTATIDLLNKNIYNKYNDKIIYQYALDKYINDRYSKNIRRIQSNNNDQTNMLNAVLLSEYRRLNAWEELNAEIKPVIMFKSQRISQSNEAEQRFNRLIENLTKDSLLKFIRINKARMKKDESHTIELAYDYYLKNEETLSGIVREIKRQFSPKRVINANDSDRSEMLERGQYNALNSLESPENLNRVVFAVAKLTEGWDVLNLYDIVRISDSDDIKATKGWTNSEAQLIGRGARYNPFKLYGNISYTRRFDDDSLDSLLLETLHYHTINESNYITNLVNSLDEMNLPTGIDTENPLHDIEVKEEFKKTKIWKHGKVFYNKTEIVEDAYYDSLSKYGVSNTPDVIFLRTALEEVAYDIESETGRNATTHEVRINPDKRFYLKAMSRNPFYNFSNMKQYLPLIESKEEFLGENWLNIDNRNIYVKVPESEKAVDLTPADILAVTEEYLEKVAQHIKRGYQKERGTHHFIGYPIKEYIADYRKRKPKYKDTGNNQAITQIVDLYNMEDNPYFIYNKTIVNKTEAQLINRLSDFIQDEMTTEDKEAYIIRMDENMHRESNKSEALKLHQFDRDNQEQRYEGFQPDFILYIEGNEAIYQIFIEPKSESGVVREKWKEDVLLFINESEGELVFDENVENFKVKGLKFYTWEDGQNTIQDLKKLMYSSDNTAD